MLSSFLLAAMEQPASVVDSLFGNNVLFLSIEIFIGGLIIGVANRLGFKDWVVACIVGLVGILSTVGYVCFSLSSTSSKIEIAKALAPFIAIMTWMLVEVYFRYSLRRSIVLKDQVLEKATADITAINTLLDAANLAVRKHEESVNRLQADLDKMKPTLRQLSDPFSGNMVSLPPDSPPGQRKLSGVSFTQLEQDLEQALSLAKKEHANSYLGIYVSWSCEVIGLVVDQGAIRLNLSFSPEPTTEEINLKFILLPIFGVIVVTVPETDYAHLKLIKVKTKLHVEGRIHRIYLAPLVVQLDHAIVTLE